MYSFPEDRRPEMEEDTIAMGFITSKSDAVLLRIISGTSNDYIELEIVSNFVRTLLLHVFTINNAINIRRSREMFS